MNKQLIITVLKALAAATLTALLLIFAFSFIALRSADPGKNLALYAYITIPLSAAAGGIVCTKADNRTFCAVVFSSCWVILSLFTGLILGNIFTKPLFSLASYAIVYLIPLAIAGRFSSGKKKKNNSRKKFLRSR